MKSIGSSNNVNDEVSALKKLAQAEIEKIKQLPQPVVRVCGPLTCDGPEGYQKNADRLAQAEKILQANGMTVWTFGDSEAEIFDKGYSDENIFTFFHKPILESGLIQTAYFLPRWNESSGATLERNVAIEANVAIKEFPEEWF